MCIPPLARSAAATKSGRMIALTVNGDTRRTAATTIAELVRELDLDPAKVAVEHNGTIAPRSELERHAIAEGDTLEIVHFVGGGQQDDDSWTVAGRTFKSRLIVGTGKYKDFAQNAAAVEASGAEEVHRAVAVGVRFKSSPSATSPSVVPAKSGPAAATALAANRSAGLTVRSLARAVAPGRQLRLKVSPEGAPERVGGASWTDSNTPERGGARGRIEDARTRPPHPEEAGPADELPSVAFWSLCWILAVFPCKWVSS